LSSLEAEHPLAVNQQEDIYCDRSILQ